MKVLIISSENNTKSVSEAVLCDALEVAFQQNNIDYSFDPKELAIDCIVLINRKLQAKARKIKKIFKIPLIYVFYKSAIAENYAIDIMNIDYTFIITDKNLNVSYPFANTLQEIGLIFSSEKENMLDEYEPLDIYMSMDDKMGKDNTLFKMMRVLNTLSKSKIEINSSNVELLGILNSNITIEDSAKDMERRVANSKLVVGSGFAILYAIKYKKPFIVVGEKGYAGVLTEENIEQYYKNFFQGALDGKFDDSIPEDRLLDDIYNLLSLSYSPLLVGDKIISQSKTATDSIIEMIEKAVAYNKQINKDFENAKVIFNPDFALEKSNDTNWLLNRYTRETITCISNVHYALIKKCIDRPIPINEFERTPPVRKRLKELRRNKVIVPAYGESIVQNNKVESEEAIS